MAVTLIPFYLLSLSIVSIEFFLCYLQSLNKIFFEMYMQINLLSHYGEININ